MFCVFLQVSIILHWTTPKAQRVASRPFGFCAPLVAQPASAAPPDTHGGGAVDRWETVDFPPVPKYHLNIHDPVEQDVFISGRPAYGCELP